jgi:hypothetical protein
MTALRAALGAVSGGLEGARIQEAAEAEKKRMADAASRQAMLDEIALADKNFVEKGVREGLVRQATPAIGNAIRTAQAAMSGNITDAQPVDFSSLGKAAGMYGDTPAASVTLGGKTFQRMQTPIQASLMAAEQAAQLASQGEVEKRRTLKAEQDTARLRATDLTARARKGDPDAKNELLATNPSVYKELFPTRTPREANVKFDDKTGMMINLDTGKATKVEGYEPVGEKVSKGEVQSGLQAMGVARASSSLNLLETNTKLMDKFEQDVLDGKAEITAAQLEAARFALSGAKGSAVAEERLMKGIPLLMSPNPALLRYVRAAKGISGAVREITPRGGSNLMMQMEQTLAGIGPGGNDPESIKQVQVFRNDILNGVREGVMSMRGDRQTQPDTRSGRPPLSSFQR